MLTLKKSHPLLLECKELRLHKDEKRARARGAGGERGSFLNADLWAGSSAEDRRGREGGQAHSEDAASPAGAALSILRGIFILSKVGRKEGTR